MKDATAASPAAAQGELGSHSVAGSRLGLVVALGALLALAVPRVLIAPFLLAYNLILLAGFLWDRAALKRVALRIRRATAQGDTLRWFSHHSLDYTLQIEQLGGPPLRLLIEESAPLGFSITPARLRTSVNLAQQGELDLTIHAQRYGSARLTHVFVRRESNFGLCAMVEAHACNSELRAYPRLPFANTPWPALALANPGSVPKPRFSAAQGGEIERLREYAPSDPMRSIDWKASAKRQRPITRSYQPERSQTLWLVLDASRSMLARSEQSAPQTRFESAFEAALALASAALGQGDQVGLLVYGQKLRLALRPTRGRAQLFALVEALLSVHPEPCELDAVGLLQTFAEQAKKRSLFVLFTDLDNGADLEQLAAHATLLTRRHLALCVSLSGEGLQRRLSAPIESERDVYRRVAAIHLKDERERVKRNLHAGGLQVIESELPGLPRAALAEYQRQKRAGRL